LNLFNSVECFFSSFNGRKLNLDRGTKSFWPAFLGVQKTSRQLFLGAQKSSGHLFYGYKKLLASFLGVLKASGQLF
jgi:hypothetical protein